MSKEARKQDEDLEFTPAERAKFDELVAMLAKRGFGENGPPRNATFAEIERFGHQAGRMVARAVDTRLLTQHADHFAAAEPCPECGQEHDPKEPRHRPLQTDDGSVVMREPAFRCSSCWRDFFPSTHPATD